MSFDLSHLDRLTQRFERSGTSIFIRTYLSDTDELVDEFEFTNAQPGAPVPVEVQTVARAILSDIARLGVGAAPVGAVTNPDGSTSMVDSAGNVIVRSVLQTTWALKPAAADSTGQTIRVTDVGGSSGSLWISDGAYWKPVGGTAIIKSSGVAISVTESAAAATEYSLVDALIPAEMMGVNGRIEVFMTWSWTTGTTRRTRLRWGGSTFSTGDTLFDRASTGANQSFMAMTGLQNRNSAASQVGIFPTGNLTLAGDVNQPIPTFTRNTAIDNHLYITAHADTGSNTKLESYEIKLIVP